MEVKEMPNVYRGYTLGLQIGWINLLNMLSPAPQGELII